VKHSTSKDSSAEKKINNGCFREKSMKLISKEGKVSGWEHMPKSGPSAVGGPLGLPVVAGGPCLVSRGFLWRCR
jgi:hypothetical protein